MNRFVLNNYQYYLSNIPRIITVQSVFRGWLVRRRISQVNREFAALVQSMNKGSHIDWNNRMSFRVNSIPTNTTEPYFSASAKKTKIPTSTAATTTVTNNVEAAIQCSPQVNSADAILQTTLREYADEEVQCLLEPVGNEVAEVSTQTPQAHLNCQRDVFPGSCKKNQDMDRLVELHNCDFTRWNKGELEKTRTELLMELCWTEQAIESRREFLAFARKI